MGILCFLSWWGGCQSYQPADHHKQPVVKDSSVVASNSEVTSSSTTTSRASAPRATTSQVPPTSTKGSAPTADQADTSAQSPHSTEHLPITLLYSVDTHGILQLCSCKPKQLGGMPRRATVITSKTAERRLLLDLGNLISGTWKYEVLKLKYLAQMYSQLGYQAVNLGPAQLALEPQIVKQFWQQQATRLVSTNVTSSQMGPVLQPYLQLKLAGQRIVIFGLVQLQRNESCNPQWHLTKPAKALAHYRTLLEQQQTIVIVMAYMPYQAALTLLPHFPQIDLLLLGGNNIETFYTRRGSTVIAAVPPWGQYLGQMQLYSDDQGQLTARCQHKALALSPEIKDHPGILLMLHDYQQELLVQRFDREGGKRKALGGAYVGSQACRDCHAQAYTIWQHSRHAKAFETLVHKQRQYDPSCLKCHTTGLEWFGGYQGIEKTPHLACVGCESCHGSAGQHSQWSGTDENNRPQMPKVKHQTCYYCHSWEHSENFSFNTFWPRIQHGKE